MGIRQQVEDATFLARNGRHVGALTNLMLAVAGSARKCFPKGFKSFQNPSRDMGDQEAFTQFLGGRIRKILVGDYGGSEFGSSGISVNFKGQQFDLAYVLYKFYRCELVHEGELPEDVEFVSRSGATSATNPPNGLSVSISAGNNMILDHGWIDLLVEAVVRARCNGSEFGIAHYELQAKPQIDPAAFERAMVSKYGITPGRFQILKHAALLITPDAVARSDDAKLCGHFADLVREGQIGGGAITGLSSRGLTNEEGLLQPVGVDLLREIALAHVLVPA